MSCHCHPSSGCDGAAQEDAGGAAAPVSVHARTLSQIVDREMGYDDDELEGLVCSPGPRSRSHQRSQRGRLTLWQRFCAALCAWVPASAGESDLKKERSRSRRNKSTPSPPRPRAATPPQEVNFLVSKTSLADYSWLEEREDDEFVARVRSSLIKKGSMLSLQ